MNFEFLQYLKGTDVTAPKVTGMCVVQVLSAMIDQLITTPDPLAQLAGAVRLARA